MDLEINIYRMEDATDVVPEQYTLTDSLDNDTSNTSFIKGVPFLESYVDMPLLLYKLVKSK